MNDTLKPCPFCGGAPVIDQVASDSGDSQNEGGYFVACQACNTSTGLRFACGEDPIPLLVEQWNRRAEQPNADLLEALEQCVKWLHDAAPMHVGQEARAALNAAMAAKEP